MNHPAIVELLFGPIMQVFSLFSPISLQKFGKYFQDFINIEFSPEI